MERRVSKNVKERPLFLFGPGFLYGAGFLYGPALLPVPALPLLAGKIARSVPVRVSALLPDGARGPSTNRRVRPAREIFACLVPPRALALPVFPPFDRRPNAAAHPGRLRPSPDAPTRKAAAAVPPRLPVPCACEDLRALPHRRERRRHHHGQKPLALPVIRQGLI